MGKGSKKAPAEPQAVITPTETKPGTEGDATVRAAARAQENTDQSSLLSAAPAPALADDEEAKRRQQMSSLLG